ncbi:hypothetical protein VSDG_01228 [Cytospora chrysosperma]|uniref:Uncharacterized protein n=1 Tax=Cytospora chrysosperma TaxID=252740 RepID=A0A423WIZ5_CYTCH|nr:hypothetical protein VSDG_01228 [Valsa sordida]
MASSTASEPEPSPPPQPSNDIDVVGISTLVAWDLADGATEYLQAVQGGGSSSLCRPKLQVIYGSASCSALFKLQLSILLKPQRNKSKNTAQFFLFIPPENIATLSLSPASGDEPSDIVQKVLSPDAICLRFALSSPPTVVAPPVPDRIVPKNEHNAGVLASLLDLARQTNITIYLPHRALDRTRLRTLCTAASSSSLTSIDRHGTATLYGGKGGRVLEASIVDAPSENGGADGAGAPAADSPPSYDELGPGPPPAVSVLETLAKGSSDGRPSRKRLRRSSSDAGSDIPSPGGEVTAKKSRDDKASRETHHNVDGMEKHTKHTEQTELRMEQMEQRLMAHLDRRLDLFEKLVKDQIQEHKRSITEMVEQRIEAHEEQTQTDLDYLRREVESDVEEQLIGKKAELHEQFRDEREELQASLEERFAELEESITERFSSARAVLEF